jgi:hypothetical protein
MGIFRRNNQVETKITFEDTPAGKRKYNVLLDVVNAIAEEKPDLALTLTENIPTSPSLLRIRGWAYAELEDLDNCLSTFRKGWNEGDVACGVYLHRLYRDLNLDQEIFSSIDSSLQKYFDSRDIQFMYAQLRLAFKGKNYSAAINNALGITFEKEKPTVSKYGATFYSIFVQLMQDLTLANVSDPAKMTDTDLEIVWQQINEFFDSGIKTAEGDSLGWNPFLYFGQIAEYIFREIEDGNFGSASVLPEFNEFYLNLIEDLDPPIPPRTFTTEEIWNALLKSLNQGDLHSIYIAEDFAEANGLPIQELKIYKDEFDSWGFEKYLQ